MIKGLKYNGEVFSYPVFEFIYPDLLKFAWKNSLRVDLQGNLIVSDGSIEELHETLKTLGVEFLTEFYKESEESKQMLFPSRYEYVKFDGNNYALDITTNPRDRIAFEIISLFEWIKVNITQHKPSSPENPE
jgi:hypothetical protein